MINNTHYSDSYIRKYIRDSGFNPSSVESVSIDDGWRIVLSFSKVAGSIKLNKRQIEDNKNTGKGYHISS